MRPRIETQAKALDEPYRVRAMIEFQETGPPRMLQRELDQAGPETSMVLTNCRIWFLAKLDRDSVTYN